MSATAATSAAAAQSAAAGPGFKGRRLQRLRGCGWGGQGRGRTFPGRSASRKRWRAEASSRQLSGAGLGFRLSPTRSMRDARTDAKTVHIWELRVRRTMCEERAVTDCYNLLRACGRQAGHSFLLSAAVLQSQHDFHEPPAPCLSAHTACCECVFLRDMHFEVDARRNGGDSSDCLNGSILAA